MDTVYSALFTVHLCSYIRKEIIVIVSWKLLNCGFWVTVNTKSSHVEPSILDKLKCRNFIFKMFPSFLLKKKSQREGCNTEELYSLYCTGCATPSSGTLKQFVLTSSCFYEHYGSCMKWEIPKNSDELKILNDSVAYFKVPSFILAHFHGQYCLNMLKIKTYISFFLK